MEMKIAVKQVSKIIGNITVLISQLEMMKCTWNFFDDLPWFQLRDNVTEILLVKQKEIGDGIEKRSGSGGEKRVPGEIGPIATTRKNNKDSIMQIKGQSRVTPNRQEVRHGSSRESFKCQASQVKDRTVQRYFIWQTGIWEYVYHGKYETKKKFDVFSSNVATKVWDKISNLKANAVGYKINWIGIGRKRSMVKLNLS